MYLVLPACSNSNVLSTLSFVKTVIDFVLYLVPSILILVLGFKLFKIVTSSNPDLKKGMWDIIGKIIICVTIFFIPTLVALLTEILAESGVGVAKDYSYCLDSATNENIAFYKEKEETKVLIEQEKEKVEKKKADTERKTIEKTREKAREKNEKRAAEMKKKLEEEKKRKETPIGNSGNNESWNGTVVDGTAQSWKDVVWDPNDVTKISNLTVEQLKAVLNAKGGSARNFIPLAEAYITNEQTNHVNAIFFISLHAIESNWVTSSVSRSCNNLGGWKDFNNPSYVCARSPSNENSTPYRYFKTKEDFVLTVGASMHKNYLTPGGSHYHGPSVSGIIQDYNCGSQSEINSIKSIGNDLFSYVKKVV